MIYGALEAGGTKMVCALGREDGSITERVTLPTKEPEETLTEIAAYFADKGIAALGIGSFGPLDLDPLSPDYGSITTTPKPGWQNVPVFQILRDALSVPVGIDTDVNASLLGELSYGDANGLSDAVYITVGTGIGGGVMCGGKLLHGMLHPELGHMLLKPHPSDPFEGCCPFHKHCLEGLASGPAIEARYGIKAEKLGNRREVWDLEAYYLGQAIVNLILTLSPKRIILGGGVMHQPLLLPLIRTEVIKQLNNYLRCEALQHMEDYIVPASLHDDQGILGCIKLAVDAEKKECE